MDVRDAVVLREPLVDKGVVRRQQIEDAAVFAEHAVEEEVGFRPHRRAKRLVEVGEDQPVGLFRFDVAHEQPLLGEVADERFGSSVAQHPPDLALEHGRCVQLPLRRDVEQGVVRNAAPEEEGKARRELEIAHARDLHGLALSDVEGLAFDSEKKLRADEQAFQRALDAAIESAFGFALLVERQQLLDVRGRGRPPICAPRQRQQDLLRTGIVLGRA